MAKNSIDIHCNFQLENFKLRDASQRHCGCKLQKMAQKNNAKKQPNIQACKVLFQSLYLRLRSIVSRHSKVSKG